MDDGAKDLDLLQESLIYLAWYHPTSEGRQVNILVEIAVAMTLELDLGKPRRSTAEVERAVVGIYCLSSCSCMAYRNPVTIKCHAKVGECWSLATGSETPPDSQFI